MKAPFVTKNEVASFLGVPAVGDRDILLRRVSSIQAAEDDAIVFAADDGSLAQAVASRAGLILAKSVLDKSVLDKSVLDKSGTTLGGDDERVLAVEDPRTAFARIYAHWFDRHEAEGRIDPLAMVSHAARVGVGCRIEAGAVIEQDVELGEECRIGPGVVIHRGTRLGARVRVQAGAVLGSDGFGYVWSDGQHLRFPQIGTLVIEDDVEIGANTTIDRGALGETRIGRGTKIDNLVHIAHNCTIGRDVLIAAQVGMAGSTTVEDGAMLGGQAGIGEHATIGRGVVLGGQGGVLPGKTIAGEGEVFWGTPAQPVREFLRGVARMRRRKD
jgi:UDP-3-O-[3-hydroxymyristoyl] glucosamine N-acyltransferase